MGGFPKNRLYSRLNWLALSKPHSPHPVHRRASVVAQREGEAASGIEEDSSQ